MGFSLKEANSFRYDYSTKQDKVHQKVAELTKQIELLQYYESLYSDSVIKIDEPITKENITIEESITF